MPAFPPTDHPDLNAYQPEPNMAPAADPRQGPVNLLEPKLAAAIPPAPRTRRRYFFIGWLALGVLLGGMALATHYRAGRAATEPASLLKPKRWSFVQTVSSFIFPAENRLPGEGADRINILLLGMGGPGHDGPYLTDTNIIVSLKPSTHEVALVSVPRDLWVNMPRYGWRRVNNASAFGEAEAPGTGGEFARQIFAETFNLDIPYYARIDFQAFVDIVNAVGGIVVDVPKAFTDSQYPGPNHSYQTVRFEAGQQSLSGEQALIYARSRHGTGGEGSDFARSRRQMQVLNALKQKLLSVGTLTNPLTIQAVFNALTAHLTTNITGEELGELARLARLISTPPKLLVLDSSLDGYLVNATSEDGAFLLAPKHGDFTAINSAIEQIFSATTTTPDVKFTATAVAGGGAKEPAVPPVRLEVQNGTWRAGLAARYAAKLEGQGFTVIRVGNALKRPLEATAIYVLKSSVPKAELEKLSQLFQAPSTTVLPEWLTESYDNPATTESEQGMKYNSDTEALVVLGSNIKE